MTETGRNDRLQTDGKFFRVGNRRVRLQAVTYGPFPDGWPDSFDLEFQQMAAAGFNSIRLFEMPGRDLLDAALKYGLYVFGGLRWGQNADFLSNPALYSAARVRLVTALRETAGHPALAGVYVGNEIPPDLVRWMTPLRVRRAIEDLIALGREIAPDLLFAYASYPSTEYLEPENADFTAFNVYLEDPEAYRKYIRRLHHIAGDRPLVISEFGLDSRRNGVVRQAETLAWASRISEEEETAGFTVYAWTDRWGDENGEVLDWDFGLVDRNGRRKPALAAIAPVESQPAASSHDFSVIICTRNGRERIDNCLKAALLLDNCFEIIVVDDGSEDGTADHVEKKFPPVRLIRLEPCGLSAARNAGGEAARGDILAFTDDDCAPDREWLTRLGRVFDDGRFAAAGGPNLPPRRRSWREAVVCAAPGAPSHVMLDDEEAEHLPGCNLVVTKDAFQAIGGFDPAFHTAGDDVDFCWRLREAGYRLGFAPGAFVWHWRRPSLRGFLRQQIGYGRAERKLIEKHPDRFSKRGGARWQGFVYGGGPVRVMEGSIIYHGPMGNAGYQTITNRMLPLRGLEARFNTWGARLALAFIRFLAPRLRSWARSRILLTRHERHGHSRPDNLDLREFVITPSRDAILECLLADGWSACGPTEDWDAEKMGAQVLLAAERGEGGRSHTLVRISGDPSLFPRLQTGHPAPDGGTPNDLDVPTGN